MFQFHAFMLLWMLKTQHLWTSSDWIQTLTSAHIIFNTCHVWTIRTNSKRTCNSCNFIPKLSHIRTWTHVTTNWKVKWFLSHWLLKPNDSFHFFLPQRARGKQKNDSRDLLTGLSGAARCRLKQPEPEAELAWTGPVVTDWDPTSDARRQRLLLLKVNHCRTAAQLLLILDWLVVRWAVGLRCESQPKGAL